MIWSGAMMLDHLGEHDAAKGIESAIERALGDARTRTRDLGGTLGTEAAGEAVAQALG